MLPLNGALRAEPSALSLHEVGPRVSAVAAGARWPPAVPPPALTACPLSAGEEFAVSVPPLTSDPLQSA